MPRGHLPARQREIVAALFVGQPEVAAGARPLGSVRCDAAASGAVMREEVREFVAERAVHFAVAKFA